MQGRGLKSKQLFNWAYVQTGTTKGAAMEEKMVNTKEGLKIQISLRQAPLRNV